MRVPAVSRTTWTLLATASAVGSMRRDATAFAESAGASATLCQAVALAVSEAVTNVVLHAYAGREPGAVTVACQVDPGVITVQVIDEGVGVAHRSDSPGMGHGLAIVGSLVQSLEVAPQVAAPGTVVTMAFSDEVTDPGLLGLEPLCALALARIADVSCVDQVRAGVLRRVAAEVAGDPEAGAWLRKSLPPAKPGTATWTALRDGGARLVVHDPTVPRSPGGTGEFLDLVWWVSIAIDGTDGQPAALWGLGGRRGGRPVPSAGVLDVLASGTREDLRDERQRAALRVRLSRYVA